MDTEKGLKYFNYGFITVLIAHIIIALIAIIFYSLFSGMEDDTVGTGDFIDIWNSMVALILGILLGLAILFIAYIIFFIGLLSFSSGKWEFGWNHSKSYEKGMLLLVIGFVITVFAVAASSFLFFAGGITSIFYALGFYFLIKEISDENTQRILAFAGGIYVAIGIITTIATAFIMVSPFLVGTNDFWLVILTPLGIGSFNLIPYAMFYYAYKRTYTRVRKGEIVPVPPPPMMPYPAPYPPYQQAYPGYAQQYPYPPQYQQYPPQYPQQYPQQYRQYPQQQYPRQQYYQQYPQQNRQYPQQYPRPRYQQPQQYRSPEIGIKAEEAHPQVNVIQRPGKMIRCQGCGSTNLQGTVNCRVCGRRIY